jgi:putative DNA-invertase from lambdoid prophage Rac
MSTFIYTRISTSQQVNGMSVDAQVAACKGYLDSQKAQGKWSDDGFQAVNDVVSGSVAFAKRERGKELWEKLKRGDVLVIAKLDRAWRSCSDALSCIKEFKKRGVELHLVDLGGNVTDGISQLVFTIMSAVADWERSRISERTKDAKREAAKQGFFVGGKRPWDKKIVRVHGKGKLVDDEKRVRIVKKLREWRKAGVPLRTCEERVKKLGETISTAVIRRLTDAVASEAGRKRGRRKSNPVDSSQNSTETSPKHLSKNPSPNTSRSDKRQNAKK